ncbi:ethyl tert-butyl ether degradation protein EthD [Nostocales cyanobacterium HT-58-2]|nr:ethyl tert-butyl ether degradation protein EthD [Nostocales cyanobacterium HT-58-2]
MKKNKKNDYAIRDQDGKAVFYVLLKKRNGIALEMFDDYWKNVHGPVCARLPGQYQYWQFHLTHNHGGLWPVTNGIDYNSLEEEQFDGIAELTFLSQEARQEWFNAAAILMSDEHNLFSKAVGYVINDGNSKTYVDGIETGDPNGNLDIVRFHIFIKKANAINVNDFRKYMKDNFASSVVKSDLVLKFRLHLLEEHDNSENLPPAPGVSHYEPLEKQYQAAFEIAFKNRIDMEKFFASEEYATAVKNQTNYIKQINTFPERNAYTFVYNGKMTLAGQRSSTVAELIANIGATNQLQDDIQNLVLGKRVW